MIKNDDSFTAYKQQTKTFLVDTDIDDIHTYEQLKDKSGNYVNVYEKVDLSNTSSITEDEDLAYWSIFDCTDGECQKTYGYLESSDASPQYFSIAYNGTNAIVPSATLTANGCAAATDVGVLLDDSSTIKLCVNHSPVTKIELSQTTYLMSNANPNVFAASSEGSQIILRVETGSITLKLSDPFNLYKVTTNKLEVPVKADFTDTDVKAKTIGLFKCNSDHTCENVSGYAYEITDSKYYSIVSTLGATAYDLGDPIDVSGNNHCSGKVGLLVKKQGTQDVYLCLDSNESIQVPTVTGNFVIGNVNTNSKLASGKMIQITSSLIVVDKSFEGIKKFIYNNIILYIHIVYYYLLLLLFRI